MVHEVLIKQLYKTYMGCLYGVQPEDVHYQAPKHVVVPYVENTLYSTNKYNCVRRVHALYISYFIEHTGDDEPHEDKKNLNSGCSSPRRQVARAINFIWWLLIFVDPQYGTSCMSPFCRLEF